MRPNRPLEPTRNYRSGCAINFRAACIADFIRPENPLKSRHAAACLEHDGAETGTPGGNPPLSILLLLGAAIQWMSTGLQPDIAS